MPFLRAASAAISASVRTDIAEREDAPQRTNPIDPLQRLVGGLIEGNAKLVGDALPGSEMRRGAIREHAVEVENGGIEAPHSGRSI